MSITQSSHRYPEDQDNPDPADGAAYSPTNWWGEVDEADTPADDESVDLAGTSRASFVAHALLKESGTLLCGQTLTDIERWSTQDIDSEPADELVTLSESVAYPPYANVGKNQHALRVNDATGYMNWTEDTWVVIADRPTSQFMAVVDEALNNITNVDLPPHQREQIRSHALRMKRDEDDLRDVEIMRHVVMWIDYPSLLDD